MTISTVNNAQPVVLVAPLDWGLGHATRCIPVIKECLNIGFEVIVASERSQKALLQKEFPDLYFVNLRGYRLKYAQGRWRTIVKIIFQIPKILIAINREHRWLKTFCKEKRLDIIIADNRFGLYKKDILSVFITHQLAIKTPFGKSADKILQHINFRYINRFNFCWVPDAESKRNFGGDLSHPLRMPKCNVRYIGILSRIKKVPAKIKNRVLVLLSGPEPQRSILETNLLLQLKKYSVPAVFIRGLPLSSTLPEKTHGVEILNHLTGAQLQYTINESDVIICRSGYSSIMEILPLNKKCIFFPTPGQTEQEYLAKYLTQKGWACTAAQNNFSLATILKEAEKLQVPDLSDFYETVKLQEVISDLKKQIAIKDNK